MGDEKESETVVQIVAEGLELGGKKRWSETTGSTADTNGAQERKQVQVGAQQRANARQRQLRQQKR